MIRVLFFSSPAENKTTAIQANIMCNKQRVQRSIKDMIELLNLEYTCKITNYLVHV